MTRLEKTIKRSLDKGRTEKEFLVMEKSRRRAMRKRLPRRKGHSSVLGAIHPWAGGRGKRGGGKVGGEILKKQKS